jgi:hypothetical protein
VTALIVNTDDLKLFARALRRSAPLIAKSMRSKLRDAGALVAVEAKTNVAEFSSSIPPTVKPSISGVNVSVVAKGVLAGLFEYGNKGSSGGGTFRHPYWGVWPENPKPQAMHPFLNKALASKADEASELIGTALDEAIDTATDF